MIQSNLFSYQQEMPHLLPIATLCQHLLVQGSPTVSPRHATVWPADRKLEDLMWITPKHQVLRDTVPKPLTFMERSLLLILYLVDNTCREVLLLYITHLHTSHTLTHRHTHARTHTHIHTHTHKQTTHTCTLTHTHSHIHTHTNRQHTQARSHTHTHTHTYTHTQTDNTLKPGPGAHSPEKSGNSKKSPSYTMGVRHSEYMCPLIIDVSD